MSKNKEKTAEQKANALAERVYLAIYVVGIIIYLFKNHF